MINPTDLRIGNNVFYKGEVVKIIGIGEFGIKASQGEAIINAKFSTLDITPIVLDKSWFIKLGFKWEIEFSNTYKWHFYNGRLRIAIYLNEAKYHADYQTWISNPNSWNGWHVVGTTMYIHQLQNLYYALTGLELPID